MEIRRYRRSDDPHVWALNNIPNVGLTADPDAPLPLPEAHDPPLAFPALADITANVLDAGGDFLVGEVDGTIVAMGSIQPSSAVEVEVNHVRVHPAMRRRGLGRLLMAALEDAARGGGFSRVHLDTATNQPEAVAFYKGLGYEEAGRETRPEWRWTLVYFTKDLTAD